MDFLLEISKQLLDRISGLKHLTQTILQCISVHQLLCVQKHNYIMIFFLDTTNFASVVITMCGSMVRW